MTRSITSIGAMAIALLAATMSAGGAVIDGTNWADNVAGYSSSIQNYGGTMMSGGMEFWLTGPPDADADHNDYAWDVGDPDLVGGWRANAPAEFFVVGWDRGIPDVAGHDLTIRCYGGPGASAKVAASVDGAEYTQIGTIGPGSPGHLEDLTFDFAGLFAEPVRYVKVNRSANGPQTGMFFDAFGGAVPEPSALLILALGAGALVHKRVAA